jgi:hemophore-related protein
MVRLSLTKFAAAVGGAGVALALTAGAGVASADPMDAAISTTCNYGQVVAALNATDPGAAAQFQSSPLAQSYLQRFLASGPVQRRQLLNQAAAYPQAAGYVNDLNNVAATCNGY